MMNIFPFIGQAIQLNIYVLFILEKKNKQYLMSHKVFWEKVFDKIALESEFALFHWSVLYENTGLLSLPARDSETHETITEISSTLDCEHSPNLIKSNFKQSFSRLKEHINFSCSHVCDIIECVILKPTRLKTPK